MPDNKGDIPITLSEKAMDIEILIGRMEVVESGLVKKQTLLV